MLRSDIEDYLRWFTVKTEWLNTDAPWEAIDTDEAAERKSWTDYFETVKDLNDDVLRWKFEIDFDNVHLGWVSSYNIDDNYELFAGTDKNCRKAVGIDICENIFGDRGIGTNALRVFADYIFENGYSEIYTQTWSGNERMIHCATKLGFVECDRKTGIREVDGKKYDALTFVLSNKTNCKKI